MAPPFIKETILLELQYNMNHSDFYMNLIKKIWNDS